MLQGNIAAWLKKIGDKISPGDAIAELETDKVHSPLLHTCGYYAIAYYILIRGVLDLAAAPPTRIATGHAGIRGC
jgi:pyruvate dehydrogenase E2 component (dihydrolipoamide acetyltransferase)